MVGVNNVCVESDDQEQVQEMVKMVMMVMLVMMARMIMTMVRRMVIMSISTAACFAV